MRRVSVALGINAVLILTGLGAATAYIAAVFQYQQILGEPLLIVGRTPVYAPWNILSWSSRWSALYPRPFAIAGLIEILGALTGIFAAALALKGPKLAKPFGRDAWGDINDAKDAGLFASSGAVLGKIGKEILCFDGPEHQILIGASRSGKGRGHVIPTLLAWPDSALVLDVKGELADGDARIGFPGTSGFRARLGPVIRVAPTRLDSNCFNLLFEVRRGPDEVRDVQNIIEVLVDPEGDGRNAEFWDRSAKQILVGVTLHVVYAEPVERKNLAVVREKLRDLDAVAKEMLATKHRLNAVTGAPETHPEVFHAATSYLAGEERLQSGIKATAESFFGLFADEIVALKTSSSDFRIGDLMCLDQPVTLYLQPPPSDVMRLTPYLRVFVNILARSLMEHQEADAQGRKKKHRLLLMLDEFPLLGRMPFFETMMGAMAGYGVKVHIVCQSLNHLCRAYGRDNVILDNCHVVTAFAASDGDTAKRIADMAGEVWEMRESITTKRPGPVFGRGEGSSTMREERRPLMLSADVRSLPRSEELIFVAGSKPIRAKKLKFDQEKVFQDRLLPPAPNTRALTVHHDWENVRAILPLKQKLAGKAKQAPNAPSKAPPQGTESGQPDLFAQDGEGRSVSPDVPSATSPAAQEQTPPSAASAAIPAPDAESVEKLPSAEDDSGSQIVPPKRALGI